MPQIRMKTISFTDVLMATNTHIDVHQVQFILEMVNAIMV